MIVRLFSVPAACCVLIALLPAAAPGEEARDPEGKQLFLKHKCNQCHAVRAADIGSTKKEQVADQGQKKRTSPPDLSGVGLKRKADWLELYLRKKTANEEGRKHKTRFKGAPAERDLLIEWMLTFKTPPETE